MKFIMWKGMEIPDKDCFKEGKKCTPDCPSYDMGWLYKTDEEIDNELKITEGDKESFKKMKKETDEHCSTCLYSVENSCYSPKNRWLNFLDKDIDCYIPSMIKINENIT